LNRKQVAPGFNPDKPGANPGEADNFGKSSFDHPVVKLPRIWPHPEVEADRIFPGDHFPTILRANLPTK
jgi:hypothetical protein